MNIADADILDVAQLNSKPNPGAAGIELACTALLPTLADTTPGFQAKLLWMLAQAVGLDAARLDEAGELADRAWKLALEADDISLAFWARCGHFRFTAHTFATADDYEAAVNDFGQQLVFQWDAADELSSEVLRKVSDTLDAVVIHGKLLFEQTALSNN